MTFPNTFLLYPSSSSLFSLALKHTKTRTHVTMHVMTQAVNTCDIPNTYTLLAEHLPSIFDSRCFNDEELPFAVEVLSTEIGHLFEHVLLEYLCELKLQRGADEAIYQGVTSWNWIRDTKGVFHITINAGLKDAGIFGQAMENATTLIHKLLDTIAYDPTRGLPITLSATNDAQEVPIVRSLN